MKIVLLLLISFPVLGQKIFLKNTAPQNITSEMSVFSEPNSRKTLEEVIRQKFTPFRKDIFMAIASNETLWLKISLTNEVATQKDWVLECGDKGIEHYIFFELDTSGKSTVTRSGMAAQTKFPVSALFYGINPHCLFSLAPRQTKTFYIKIAGDQSRAFRLRVMTPEDFNQRTLINSIQNSFLLGALLIRLIYVFLLAVFAVKERIFRVYGFHLLLCALAFFGVFSTLGGGVSSNPSTAIIINNLSTHFLGFSFFLFTLTVLPLRQFPLVIAYLLRAGLVLNLLVALLLIFNYNWIWVKVSLHLCTYYWLFSIGLFGFSLVKKINVNWYYVIPFLLGNGYGAFAFLQTMAPEWHSNHVVFVDSLFRLIFITEFIFFGYFVGKIIRDYERSKVSSEKKLLFEKAHAERLAELDTLKTTFFANISHEFRTPLTLLVGPMADFKKKYPEEGLIPVMQRNLVRLQTLINQLLDLSKLEAGKMEPVIQYSDLAHFFNYLFASFESLAQSKNIIFQYDQNQLRQPAYFDEDKVEKIVTNLLSNAFKFTPENGRIAISVNYTPASESGALTVITVTDTGIGIDPQRLPRIFDRFYQVDDSQRRHYEGTGIGLALVKELVTALRGTIDVQSQPGKGTTFVVNLPCDQGTWGADLTPEEQLPERQKITTEAFIEENSTPSSKNTDLPIVLIVEDNPDLRKYVRSIFEENFQVEEAQDGQHGIDKAFELVPDLVICDLMMPRLDGFEFCKLLKTDIRTNHIPVVMLTAKASLKDRLEGLDLGADEYLSKPFNTDELQIRVRNLLKQRQLLRYKYSVPKGSSEQLSAISQTPVMPDVFMEKANKILGENLADSRLDVEKFAVAMDMTAVQLRRKLKALTDQTVTEYVRNYRLAKAAELLKNKAGTVSEIAYRVGFESLSYFSKVFMEKYGKTPSDWS